MGCKFTKNPAQENFHGKTFKIRRKQKKSSRIKFDIYIRRINEMVNQNSSLSKDTVTIINDLLNDFLNEMGDGAAELSRLTKRKTILARDMEAITKLKLSGHLLDRGILESRKAVEIATMKTCTGDSYAMKDCVSI